jgi:D-glycero-alpha-D-manno-heptose 1-phosphate guanylyltransferase
MNVSQYPAIILAGGLGTRLQSVVNDLPKAMAPINGKPFLHYLFLYLQKQGIQEIILSVGYKHEIIEQYFGKEYAGIKIKYSIEEEALGTGGAIKRASAFCENRAFIINGDTFFDIDLQGLHDHYFEVVNEITVALKPMTNFNRYGSITMNEETRIVSFNEKKELKEGLINGGVYFMHTHGAIQEIEANKFSFEKEVLEGMVSKYCFSGKTFDNYFIDIGIPEDYAKAQEDFKRMFP